ncbi:MAG: tRNA lysidine(34) synthetase TilS, partial [Anaerolineales bacterium]|nr:tRNA lysidine(34) synthetase TilS [Anaerolineales bacterium]
MTASDLQSEVLRSLMDDAGLSLDQLILVGISGGPDSLCLFDLMADAGWNIAAAHLDHSLRPGSAHEARVVREWVEARSIPFYSETRDVRAHAGQNKLSLEEAARDLRYAYLFELAGSVGAAAVAVGHHADDQVETVLMHFLRGSGLRGLRGMQATGYLAQYSPRIPLVRPLLNVWRSQILAYCREKAFVPIEDETNLDPSMMRNRIRLELVPELESYNPRIREIISRSAKVFAGNEQLLDEYLQNTWDLAVAGAAESWIRFDAQKFADCSPPMQRLLVRKAVFQLDPGLRDYSVENTQML